MGMKLIAVLGVLLLGAGVTILVVNLRRAPGTATLDQIGTYGYVAEAAGGSEVEAPGRRPLDSLAGRLGDIMARRLSRSARRRCARSSSPRGCTERARASFSATR